MLPFIFKKNKKNNKKILSLASVNFHFTCLLPLVLLFNLMFNLMLNLMFVNSVLASTMASDLASNKVKNNSNYLLMPYPQSLQIGQGVFTLKNTLNIYVQGMSEPRQKSALKRFSKQLKRASQLNFSGLKLVAHRAKADIVLIVTATDASYSLPQFGDDESYQLSIAPEFISIQANSDFGALQALTTLMQLITTKAAAATNSQQLDVLSIIDAPRFKWRGLLIDSVRHFIPISALKRQLDGMAAAKLNVFHWHLTDDQGWRIESKSYPKLHQLASEQLYYSQNEIKDLVAYASLLGIRVVPEFDVPGHASAIAVAYPELMAVNKSYVMEKHWGVFEPLLDVSDDKVYQFIDTLVAELASLFPDSYLHIGGDEVNPKQWLMNSDIKELMAEKELADSYDLHRYFNARVQKILAKHQRKMMGWDEIFHQDLPEDILIQSWRGLESLNLIAASGYNGLLSTGYYIDQPQSTAYHYRNEPLANIAADKLMSEINTKVNINNSDAWQTWSLTIPRLKGSAVKGSLTLVYNKTTDLTGYLKLNNNHYKTLVMHTSLADLAQKQVSFSLDTWMGPMYVELNLAKAEKLSGKVLIGNSYYPVEGKEITSKQSPSIELLAPLTPKQAKNILGGEATLWTEMVDERNIDLRTWPRLFAIAERFWSSKSMTDVDNMYQRLQVIDDYAANIIGLWHQKQQHKGFSTLLSQQNKRQVTALMVLAQAIEPAHYYTRHHLKYQQNKYHQLAPLDNYIDYLPVESFTLITMMKQLKVYQAGDKSALVKIKHRLSVWRDNQSKLEQLVNQEPKLADLSLVLADMKQFNALALTIVQHCEGINKLATGQSLAIKSKLAKIQRQRREEVLAAVPLFQQLLTHCNN